MVASRSLCTSASRSISIVIVKVVVRSLACLLAITARFSSPVIRFPQVANSALLERRLLLLGLMAAHGLQDDQVTCDPVRPLPLTRPSDNSTRLYLSVLVRPVMSQKTSQFIPSSSLFRRACSRLTMRSASVNRPSHSLQHSPMPTTPISCHLLITLALCVCRSESCRLCISLLAMACCIRGCSDARPADSDASGTGRSLSDVNREAAAW